MKSVVVENPGMKGRNTVENILESMGDAFVSVDHNWRYTFVNRNISRLFPDPRFSNRLLGKVMWDALPELKGTLNEKVYREVMEGRKPMAFETKSPVADVWVEVRVCPHEDGIAIFFRDITERKRAHEELIKSEERFVKIFRSSAAAQSITSMANGLFVDANDAFLDLLGFTREEVIGKTVNDIGIYDYAPPGERENILYVINKNGGVQQYEIVLRQKNGGRVDTLLSAEILELHGEEFIAASLLDITEMKRNSEELRKSEDRFTRIFRSSAAAQSITRLADGEFIDVNDGYTELFGFDRGELIGRTLEELGIYSYAPPGQRERLVRLIRRDGGVYQVELKLRQKSGEPVDVLMSAEHLELHGENLILASLLDITEKKKVEEELSKLNDSLEEKVREKTLELTHSLEREKSMNDLKSQFVSTASHEFRTPLATIHSSVTLIEKYVKQDPGGKVQKHLERIKGSVNNLTEILNDFLSLEKMEKGKTVASSMSFDLPELVTKFVEQFSPNLKLGQTISYSHEGDNDLFQDTKIISNSLSNLLSNASKYSAEGAPIYVRTKVSNGTVTLSVKDNGIGIPEKDMKHLFTLFFRANNVAGIQGTGLGLIIVKKYMEILDGDITFRSKEKEGSEFTLTFPAHAEQ